MYISRTDTSVHTFVNFILLLFFFLLTVPHMHGIPVPQLGILPVPPAVEVQSL